MRNIRTDASRLTFIDELEFTDAALSANPLAADLAQAVADKILEWDDVSRKERAWRRTVTRGDAVVAVRDDDLDALTMKVAALAFVEGNQDRRSAFPGDEEAQRLQPGQGACRATTYAELFKRAADKGYGKAWAETFFRKASASDLVDEPGPTPGGPRETAIGVEAGRPDPPLLAGRSCGPEPGV